MKCFCCLTENEEKKSFCVISAADKKHYRELTKLELNIELKIYRVCKSCKELLKTSSSFLQTCLKSHEILSSECLEQKAENRITRKRKFKHEVLEEETEFDEEEIPEHTQEDSDDEDDLPISTLQQQLQNNKEHESYDIEQIQKAEFFEDVVIERTREDSENSKAKSPRSKKSPGKFLCPECGVSFQTSQRLKIHSFTHSGLKSFNCEYDGCNKSFATSKFILELC